MGKLWVADKIYTMRKENDVAEAIFTKEGKIVSVGSKEELKQAHQNDISETIELDGTVIPAFIDSHLHIVGYGQKLSRLDLSNIKRRNDILQSIKEEAGRVTKGTWLIGDGFNENSWDDSTMIHIDELDAISTDIPIVINRVCRHALVANSKAIELAELNLDALNEGEVEKDSKGKISGVFHEEAADLIKENIPQPSVDELADMMNKSIDSLLSFGIVSGHTEDLSYFGFHKAYEAYKKVISDRKDFRAHLLVHHLVVDDFYKEGLLPIKRDDWLEFGAMKIFVDGALGGRTALLSEPYADDPSKTGLAVHSDEELKRLVEQARSYGMNIAVHVIGDLALEKILDLIEQIPPKAGLRDRIIHAQITRPDLVERMKELPIIVDIQPTFVASDFPWVIDRVGEERAKHSYTWRKFIDEGLLCAGGSDAPIEDANPLLGIHAAVKRASAIDGKSYYLDQALSVFEAVQLYTTNAAKIIDKGDLQGLIAPGHFADFIVLNDDIFEIDGAEIKDLQVKKTIVNENIAFEK